MTRAERSAAGMLFAAVLILGGWAWSQDDPVASPSDVTAGALDSGSGGATADDPQTNVPQPNVPQPNVPQPNVPADDDPEAGDRVTADVTADSAGPDRPSVADSAGPAAVTTNAAATAGLRGMIFSLWIFALAVFLGIEVISKVPPTLHTPLMSGSNAISGITLVGAVIVAAAVVTGVSSGAGIFARFLGFIAVALAMINAVGGFLVTHRMLAMFTRK